jgi:multiple sugar transport system substrate-binding protein
VHKPTTCARRRWRFLATALVASAALGLAACGGDEGGGGGGGGEEPTGPAAEAKSLRPDQAQNASGNITYCIGGSLEGHRQVVRAFNQQGNVKASIVELSEAADEQRRQQIQRLQAKSEECDVLAMDVIWTAEYASQGWVYDLTPVADERRDEFIASTLESATYQGKAWAIPINSNAGFLYFRTNVTRNPPETWQQVYQEAGRADGIVYQGARYEGLTVNFLEYLFSAGGTVLNEDGTQSTIDSQQARDALQFMVDGIKNGAAPKAVTTYQEEQARRAFESERASFMRNWPYAYDLGNQSDIKGRFEVAPFPQFEGGEAAGVLGGYNLGINASSDNPEGALAFVNYYSSPEAQETMAVEGSLPPVLGAVYDDAQVKKAMPFAAELKQAIEQAKPRPVSPVYPQISEAIYTNAHQALTGRVSVDQAVKAMHEAIQRALETF